MGAQILADNLYQPRIQDGWQGEVLIKTPLPAKCSRRNRLWTKLRKAELLEWHARKIESLRASVIFFSVHTVLVVTPGMIADTILGFQQENRAGPEDDSSRWANAGASRLQSCFQPMAAQLALCHPGIEARPLKSRDLVRAGDGAITTANALFCSPAHDAALRIFMQSLKRTSSCARWIQAVHALPLDERKR